MSKPSDEPIDSDWESVSTRSIVITPPTMSKSAASTIPPSPPSTASTVPRAQNSTYSTSELLVICDLDVATAIRSLSIESIVASQSSAFASFSSDRRIGGTDFPSLIQVPPRISLDLAHHTTLIMPSRCHGAALKIVSVPRGESSPGLPASNLVIDETTGKIEAIINSGELTGLRTAAGSAVASRMLLGQGKGRKTIVVFGAGVQAFWHIHLHLQLFPQLEKVILVGRPSAVPSKRTVALIEKLANLYPNIDVYHSSVPDFDRGQAVHNADIIVCCTPSTIPLFPATQPRRGTHVILVGSYKPTMMECEPEMLNRAHAVFVDGHLEVQNEAGEFQAYQGQLIEIGSLIGNSKELKTSDVLREAQKSDLTIFKSVGLAVQDVAITQLVLTEARKLGLGTRVPF